MAARVSLVKGDQRYANVRRALDLVQEDIVLEGAKRIVVKPNFTSVTRALAVTHVDATRALLDFLRERTSATIIVAEGSGTGSPPVMEGFRRFGYLPMKEDYDVRFVDLNDDQGVDVSLYDQQLRPLTLKVARTLVEADYRISICPPKTHDCVIMTASVKNMIMGSLLRRQNDLSERIIRCIARIIPPSIKRSTPMVNLIANAPVNRHNHKASLHQGYPSMNLNLFKLAKMLFPHLSVIDGFQGMEGAGPIDGEPVNLGIAMASRDPLAADATIARIMGFNLEDIGYLYYCYRGGLGEGDIRHISILGDRVEACARPFIPHPAIAQQRKWHLASPDLLIKEGIPCG